MRIIAALAACLCTAAALAIPAKPTPITYTQPDGSEITVMLRGDERSHYFLSEDGYLLVRQNEAFYYGNINADGQIIKSDCLARPKAKRSAADQAFLCNVDMERVYPALASKADKAPARNMRSSMPSSQQLRQLKEASVSATHGVGLFPGSDYPVIGEQRAVVILVSYKNVNFTTSDPYDYFSRMLMEEGFSEYGGTGSARDYFVQNSSGLFTPDFDVYGPVTLPENQSYYGGNDLWGSDQRPHEMAIHAMQILDDEVDFSQYDRDGDGYIDNVYIFYAGRGEASGGSESTVWPHSWNVTTATSTPYYFDGVRLDRYACSNEWEGSKPDGVGTFIHEFSHVMGLPDLYATGYSSAFTPGSWSAMDYGPYNNDGRTPPNYSAFERNALTWITPAVLTGEYNNYELPDITSNTAFVIETEKNTEFFLIENRQKQGWDAYIPGHGMLVWHIDYNSSIWNNNKVNDTANHQYVDLEEADNICSEYTRAGDSFPGSAGVTSITDDTSPSLKTWAKKATNVPISGITESNGLITFGVGVGVPEAPVALEATAVTPYSFIASWQPAANASYYNITVRDNSGASPTGWEYRKVGVNTSTTVKGLSPETTYTYTVWASNDTGTSPASNEITVTTTKASIESTQIAVLPATNITGSAFTANWEPLAGIDKYLVSIYDVTREGGETDVVNFDNGVEILPEGWSTTSDKSYKIASYCGANPPSLRFAQEGNLTSPTYSSPISRIQFWNRGVNANSGNCFVVSGLINGSWEPVATIYPSSSAAQTSVVDFPEETYGAMIEYVEAVHSGAGVVDDVVVTIGGRQISAKVGYQNLDAGSNSSLDITGLISNRHYAYTVIGFDGEAYTASSPYAWVTTANELGITDCTTDAVARAVGQSIVLDSAGSIYSVDGRMVYSGAPAEVKVAPGVYIVRTKSGIAKLLVK